MFSREYTSVTDQSLILRAKEILGTPNHKGIAILVAQVFEHEDNKEKEIAKLHYKFCYLNFPNCLTLKLLNLYRCSFCRPKIRLQSLFLLHSLLSYFKNTHFFFLSLIALHEIKPLLITCLLQQETPEFEFKTLARIVSHVTHDVFMMDNNGWIELSECIIKIADYNVERAIFVFRCLPFVLDDQFLMVLLNRLFPAIMSHLEPRGHGGHRLKEWILGLEAGFNMAVQLVNSQRSDLSENILYAILKSTSVLVKDGLEETVREGFEALATMVSEEGKRFSRKEYEFVLDFLYKMERMREIGEETVRVLKKIHQILREKCFEIR